jgi:hypothetical protein
MDLGPQWPFWLRSGCALLGAALLARVAWRHAGAVRRWPAAALGLGLWWCVALLPWWQEAALCRASPVELPGCDWEYHRAPTDPRELLPFILLGGAYQAIRFGGPIAALTFSLRLALPRLRRTSPPPPAW